MSGLFWTGRHRWGPCVLRRPFLAPSPENKDRDRNGQRVQEEEERESRKGSEDAEQVRVDGDEPRLRLRVAREIGRPNGESMEAIGEDEGHVRGEPHGLEMPAVDLDLIPRDAGSRIGSGPADWEGGCDRPCRGLEADHWRRRIDAHVRI